jgi:poly-gamma-glutamate system protein
MTPVTSNTGSLPAKQTTINPNFAAVLVHLLKRVGLEEGDVVAVGFSGSFPALNVAVMAAISVLGLKPIIISSNAASQWGANDPEFLWIDWERALTNRHIFNFRSVAASIGGIEDRGLGMTPEGRRTIVAAIEAAGVPVIRPRNYLDSVEERWSIFHETAGDLPIKAYINVGGGTTSVGTKVGKHLFKPGINLHPPASGAGLDSVMSRFADDGIPVIHLVNIAQLAKRWGLPTQPQAMPAVGQGKVYSRAEYNPWLAGGSLLVIFAALYAFVRSDLGFRMLRWSKKKKSGAHPEPMV